MSTTTITPTAATLESPKLVRKQSTSEIKSPSNHVHSSYGCPHIKQLLEQAREQAMQQYTRLIQAVTREKSLAARVPKSSTATAAVTKPTYLCLQCSTVAPTRERHKKDHPFSVESAHGCVFCHDCRDFIYDPALEEIRTSDSRKRKLSNYLSDTGAKLISTNSTTTPCAATGLRGLYNMGQTCFMSVVLQSIIHNPFIRSFYLAEGHRSIDCEREACTSCALDDIFTDFHSTEKHEGYGAVAMLQGSWRGGGSLAGYSQQDAHEYLGFILNSLHAANLDGDEDNQKNGKDCECVVHQTFGGLLKSTVTCGKCKNTTTAIDPFMDLSLDIRNQVTQTKKKKLALINGTQTVKELLPMDLTECLDRFTSAETLSSADYHCRKCDSAQTATKKFGLWRLPPMIPIHLKRFSHSKSLKESVKIDTKIRFPLSLDLSPYTTQAASNVKSAPAKSENRLEPVYELSSVVIHKGKLDNGHYISYSRQGDEWFRFDDSMVVLVDEKEVLGAEAYMLFYIVREFDA